MVNFLKKVLSISIRLRCLIGYRADLNARYLSFRDRTIDEIEASHVLEHLERPLHLMMEFHRILRQNGKLSIQVPHFSRAFVHPEHVHGFDVSFLLYYDTNFRGGYQHVKFYLIELNLSWFAQRELKRDYMNGLTFALVTGLAKIIDILANASPYFCSKVWCYWVGGFDQVEFVFRKP